MIFVLIVCADVAVAAVQALIDSAALNAIAVAQAAAEQSQGLRQAPESAPLSPEGALMW